MGNSRILKVWKEHYEKLINEEFIWKRDGLETLSSMKGPCEPFAVEEVRNAIHSAKNGKETRPSVVLLDMLK